MEFVIWSIEHNAWWRPDECGYCEKVTDAGRYSRARATAIVRQANIVACHECMIPVTAVTLDPLRPPDDGGEPRP
jgi:hypothetical protein